MRLSSFLQFSAHTVSHFTSPRYLVNFHYTLLSGRLCNSYRFLCHKFSAVSGGMYVCMYVPYVSVPMLLVLLWPFSSPLPPPPPPPQVPLCFTLPFGAYVCRLCVCVIPATLSVMFSHAHTSCSSAEPAACLPACAFLVSTETGLKSYCGVGGGEAGRRVQ